MPRFCDIDWKGSAPQHPVNYRKKDNELLHFPITEGAHSTTMQTTRLELESRVSFAALSHLGGPPLSMRDEMEASALADQENLVERIFKVGVERA